jgi:hypothetical protein
MVEIYLQCQSDNGTLTECVYSPLHDIHYTSVVIDPTGSSRTAAVEYALLRKSGGYKGPSNPYPLTRCHEGGRLYRRGTTDASIADVRLGKW